MSKELIQDWIIKEIDNLTKEKNQLLEWNLAGMHPHPAAISNSWRLGKSSACRAKIDAYIKLLDYIEEL